METSISIFFERVKDPRIERKKEYPLDEILLVGLSSIMAGGEGFHDMQLFGEEKLKTFRKILPFEHGIPSEDTYARVFSLLEPVVFRDCFMEWVQDITKRTAKTIAIDGKSLRGSRRKNQPALHMVSAWADEQGLILAQKPVRDKSNEIVAIKELLEILDLKGSVITIDAIGCQKAVARKIVENKGDYVLALKENQKMLNKEVKEVFEGKRIVPQGETVFDEYEVIEKGHGRIERRQCRTISVINLPLNVSNWAGLSQLVEVTSSREVEGKRSTQKRYYITSLGKSAEEISRYIRGHWGIENRAHWVLDVVFREDSSRIQQRRAAENMAVLRHVAMNLVRQDPAKGSLRAKRKKAGWSNDYLLTLLLAKF